MKRCMSGTSTILIKAVCSHDVGVLAGGARGLLAPSRLICAYHDVALFVSRSENETHVWY